MPYTFISEFLEGTKRYRIEAESNDGTDIRVLEFELGQPVASTKPIATTYLNSMCVNYTQYKYYAKDPYPFVTFNTDVNSPYCGYSPIDALSVDVVVTDETAFGANDGIVRLITGGGSGSYLYSLDGISFSPYDGQDITGLSPGNYTVILQDTDGLQVTKDFIVGGVAPIYGCTDPTALNYNPLADVDGGNCVYPVPDNDDPDSRQNLYETVDQFRLINSSGEIFVIEMPQGWDKVVFKLQRDEQYHGVNYEFSDGAIQLDFDSEAGKDLLQDEYDQKGNDGFMQFQFGMVSVDGKFTPDVDAYVDFNTKTNDRDFFSASVKTKIFNDSVETKNEVDVTLKDGYFNMPLHSKLIRKQTVVNRNFKSSGVNSLGNNVVDDPNPNTPAPGDAPFMVYWTFLDFSKPAETESGFSSYINDLMPNAPLFGVTQSNPVATSQYQFVADGGGVFIFNIGFSLTFRTKVLAPLINDSRTGYWSYKWFLVINGVATRYELPGSQSGFTNSRFNNVNFTTNFNLTLNLNQGDRVYLFGQYVFEKINTPGGFEGTIDINYMNVRVQGDTLATPTTTQSKLAYEVCQDILNSISAGTAKLKSNLLGRIDLGYDEDGCAALIAYTSGYLIRNFPLSDRPLIIQLKDFIEGLDTNFAIGMGYELNELNEWVYRIEQFEYFYQDVLIMTFDEVSDYSEPINTKLIYNELTFGYQKYTQDLESVSSIDEFLTQHKYLTPIQSYKAAFVRLCKQIAGGYPIELTRRKQYLSDPQASWTYDEDNFIIKCVRDTVYGYRPEKLENYTASGILSPETAYNIGLTITRMLARWGKWINSGLAFKTNAEIIENTYTSKNGDLTSKYTGSNPCEPTKEFTESNDLLKGDLANGEQVFFPEEITFKTKLSWEKIREIKRCFINKDTDGRNNGYFGVVDGDGVTKYGYLTSLEYNPESELTTFFLKKKYVDLNQPFDCSEYAFYTFADFEAATGLPKEIEQCLFENFA